MAGDPSAADQAPRRRGHATVASHRRPARQGAERPDEGRSGQGAHGRTHRLAIIHNGNVGLTGVGLLRFDITNGIANQGYSVGNLLTNRPLSDWNSYLSTLLVNECSYSGPDGKGPADGNRVMEFGVSERLVCPVMDIKGRLLGGLFIT